MPRMIAKRGGLMAYGMASVRAFGNHNTSEKEDAVVYLEKEADGTAILTIDQLPNIPEDMSCYGISIDYAQLKAVIAELEQSKEVE